MESSRFGNIYKIVYVGNENVTINYIGSTFNTTRDRFKCHIATFKNWCKKKDKRKFVSIYPYFEKYGTENFKMMLIKQYEVCDKSHLFMYEQLWMNKLKNINQLKAFQPLIKEREKLYREANKLKIADYYQVNKEKLVKYQTGYYHSNKSNQLAKAKEYYKINREKLIARSKAYYQNKKNSS